jgi:glutathione synthase/RimK-type ligase-like ATP-grasp enzyme
MLFIARARGVGKSARTLFENLKPGIILTTCKTFNKGLYGFLHEGDTVINWGCSKLNPGNYHLLNKPEAVRCAIDKVSTLKTLAEANIAVPYFSTNQYDILIDLLHGNFEAIYCRTLIRSKKGNGIVIARTPEELVPAKLYTRAFPTTHEFRVHVFMGEAIDYVQKKKRRNADADLMIRNHDRGWVFAHDNIIVRKKIKELAVNAVEALGLHFGAVDVLARFNPPVNGKWQLQEAVVCEVNTAPGLSNTKTLEAYVNCFNNYKGGMKP